MRSVGRRAGPGNTESSLRSVEWGNDETESEERRGEEMKLFRAASSSVIQTQSIHATTSNHSMA